MQLWDTAGQERFKSLIPSYIKQAYVAIMVFDVTSIGSHTHSLLEKETFEGLNHWMQEVRTNKGDNALIVVAGNKIDAQTRYAFSSY